MNRWGIYESDFPLDREIDRHTREPEPAEPDCEPEDDEREPDERPIIHTLKRP